MRRRGSKGSLNRPNDDVRDYLENFDSDPDLKN